MRDVENLLKFANDTMFELCTSQNSDRVIEGLHQHFNYINCLPKRKFERLVGPLDEIMNVSVAQIQRHNATS